MAKNKDAKPNASPGLLAPKPAGKSGKKTLGLIGAVIIILLAVLMSGLTSGAKEDQGDLGTAPASVESENKPLTPPMEGFGLVAPDQPEKKEEAEIKPEIITVGPPAVDPEREARRREADEIRRRRFDREQQAYGAALLVKREGVYASGGGSVDKDGDGYIDPVPSYGPSGPDAYDPAADP